MSKCCIVIAENFTRIHQILYYKKFRKILNIHFKTISYECIIINGRVIKERGHQMAYKYNDYAGVIYDSIYYNIVFLNKDRIIKSLLRLEKHESEILKYYNKFKNGIGNIEPDENFYPLFYYDIGNPSVMSEYFRQHFDLRNGTFLDYLELIKDVRRFKRFVFLHYTEPFQKNVNIEAVIKGDSVEIGKVLVALSDAQKGKWANTYVRLFYNFEELAKELLEYMKILIDRMNLFHLKNKRFVKATIDTLCIKENANLCKKLCNIEENVDLSKQIYSVCFMNKYFIMKHYHGTKYNLMIGIDSAYHLHEFMTYRYVTGVSASRLISNEIMHSMVQALRKEDMTITQLSKELNISRPTADRFINILKSELAITMSKKESNEKYYQLNLNYFKAAQKVLNEIYGEIILDCERNEQVK